MVSPFHSREKGKKKKKKYFIEVRDTFLVAFQFSSPMEIGAPRMTTLSMSPAAELSKK